MHRQWFLRRTILHQRGQGPEHQREWLEPQLERQTLWHQTLGQGPENQMHLSCWPLLRIAHRQLVPGLAIQRD